MKSAEISDKVTKILKCSKCGNTAFQELMTVAGQTPRPVNCPLCKTEMEIAKAGKGDVVVSALPRLMIHSDGTEVGTEIYIEGIQLSRENLKSVYFSYYPTDNKNDKSPMVGPSSPVSFSFSKEETYDGVKRRITYDFFVQQDGTMASKKRDENKDESHEKFYRFICEIIDSAIAKKKEGGDK